MSGDMGKDDRIAKLIQELEDSDAKIAYLTEELDKKNLRLELYQALHKQQVLNCKAEELAKIGIVIGQEIESLTVRIDKLLALTHEDLEVVVKNG